MTLTGNITLGLVLMTCVVSPVRSLGDTNRQQSLTVVVHTGAGVEPALVKRGLDEAARLYRRGDLLIEWRDSATGQDHSCLYLIVTRRDVVRAPTFQRALGTAPREPGKFGRISYVFVEPIETLAATHGVDASLVLGAAIAHELGHLLLPGRPHTQEGLMRASWGSAEAKAANRGALRFLPSDFTAMRSRLPPFVVAAADSRSGQP